MLFIECQIFIIECHRAESSMAGKRVQFGEGGAEQFVAYTIAHQITQNDYVQHFLSKYMFFD